MTDCPRPDPLSSEVITDDCTDTAGPHQMAEEPCDGPIRIEFPQRDFLNLHAAVLIKQSWNIPKCNETVVLILPDFKKVPIGGFLWSSQFGLFQILRRYKEEVTLVNTCSEGNAPIGNFVPANSTFILSASPVVDIGVDIAYLGADFVTPPLGQCTIVRLTSLNGIAAGMQVSIAGGTYLITESIGGGVVRVCENGGGLQPGTLISYKNVFGQNQVPITALSSSIVLKSRVVASGELSSVQPNLYIITNLIFKNPFINKSLAIKYNILGNLNGTVSTTDSTNPLQFDLKLFRQFDNQLIEEVIKLRKSAFVMPAVARPYSAQIRWAGVVIVPAMAQTVLYTAFQASWNSVDEFSKIDISELSVQASAIGALV